MFYKSTYFLQLCVFVTEQQLEAFVADHDFQHHETFVIDSFFFHCVPPSNKKVASPQLICAEMPFWALTSRSLTSTQDSTTNKVTYDDKQQLGPHPTKNDPSSSSSSLYPMLSCPDLCPMICCRLLQHSSLNLRLISTL